MSNTTQTMDDCIREIPALIRRNTAARRPLTAPLVQAYLKSPTDKIQIIASGSSYNAAMCARLYMQKLLKKEVQVLPPYTFTYWENDFTARCFPIVASQSGNSTNSLAALAKLREKGLPAIGITANPDSDFSRCCSLLIDYQIGTETVGFVTKGMTGLILFFMLFALEAAYASRLIDEAAYEAQAGGLAGTAALYEEVYEKTKRFFKANKRDLLSTRQVFVIGSGPCYGAALEGALKIGETLGVCSFAYESEEFLHGPNFQVNDNYTCFFLDNNDATGARLRKIYEATLSFTGRCYRVGDAGTDPGRLIETPSGQDPFLCPLYCLAALQSLAFCITDKLNRWPVEGLADAFDRQVHIKSR